VTRREREPEPAPKTARPGETREADWQTRLSEAMEARALSGGELARRAGFTSQYMNSLRAGDRGARLPHDTARRIAQALGVSVDWLVKGDGPRERLSDVYVVRRPGEADPFPSRAEAIALLATSAAPEVIEALRAAVPDPPDADPGREWWIAYAKELARDLRRIKDDPDFSREAPPKSAYLPVKKK
jgi:transcriptional regulator with XRE-family HTH domain